MISAIIFDFGGVLVNDTDDILFENIAERFGIGYGTAVAAANEFMAEYQEGKISDDNFWYNFSKKVGKNLPGDYQRLWIDKYASKTRPNLEVQQIIRRLKNNGYKVGCLSNTIPPHAKYNREQRYFDIFDTVLLSCETGLRKSEHDPAPWMAGAKSLGVLPENCVYIDDKPEYLKCPKSLGMATIHYTAPGMLESEFKKLKML